jgi:hypothetical protein
MANTVKVREQKPGPCPPSPVYGCIYIRFGVAYESPNSFDSFI